MGMFIAYPGTYAPIESEHATISNPTSQASPDGLAANLVTRSGSVLGPDWVAGDTDSTIECDITFGTPISPGYVVIVASNLSAAASVKLYRGPVAGPRTLVATLGKCSPANVWIAVMNGISPSAKFSLTIVDNVATLPLQIPYLRMGARVALDGLYRERRDPELVDLSTHTGGQLGSSMSCEQRTQFKMVFPLKGTTASFFNLRLAFEAVKTVRPLVVCFDDADPTAYGNTIVGLLQSIPVQKTDPGMLVSVDMVVNELIA